MSFTSLIFFAIILTCVWRGYRRGFTASITPILSWLIAYPVAIFFTKPFANWLAQHTALDGVVVYMVAGCAIFFSVSIVVGLILNLIARSLPSTDFTQASSKFGGAVVGMIVGCLFGLICVYIIDLVKKPASVANTASIDSDQHNGHKNSQQEELFDNSFAVKDDTFIESSAKKLVSTAASTAVDLTLDDKTVTQMTKAFTQDPQTMLSHVQQITNDGQMKALLAKPEFQAQLNAGDVNGLMRNKDFQQLMDNRDMQAILSSASGNANNPAAQQAAAEKMVAAWQKVDTLKSDPRVLQILNDPAFQQQLNSPNKLSLMMNPRLRELTEIIFNSQGNTTTPSNSVKNTNYHIEDITQPHPGEQTPSPAADSEQGNTTREEKIYRWKDANGKTHFSDKPIKDQ